jgi:hypothetical protein
MTSRLLIAISLFVLSAASAVADNRIYCYQKVIEASATGGGKVQANGFRVEVGPAADPDNVGHMTCRATIVSPKGQVVFESNAWGMEIDPITGQDINGDGQPEAVLVSFSGGAHCCWTHHIISLGKKPGLLREFENGATASFKDLRGNGQIEILVRDDRYDGAFGLDHAFSVFPLLTVELKGSEFNDVGSYFWPVYEKEIQQERSKLNDQQLQQFLRSNPDEVHDDLDYLRTKSSILLIVLDYLYAGRPEEAQRVLRESWPKDSQEGTWKDIVSGFCSGLRARLGLEATPLCGGK